jgi:hypothetical protein
VFINVEDKQSASINIGPGYLQQISHGIPLGNGDEDSTRDALDKICSRLMDDNSIPRLPEGFNVIPDRESFLLMDGSTEKYKIVLPDLQIRDDKKQLAVHKPSLKEYASITTTSTVEDIRSILEAHIDKFRYQLGIEG